MRVAGIMLGLPISPMQPHPKRRQQLFRVDRLRQVVGAPASRHFSRSPFIAFAVRATMGAGARRFSRIW